MKFHEFTLSTFGDAVKQPNRCRPDELSDEPTKNQKCIETKHLTFVG